MEEDLVLPGEEALASSSDSDTDGEPEPRTGRRAGGATAAQLDADQRRWVYVVPVDAKERKLLMAELGESVAKGVVLKQSVDGVISCLEHTNEKTGLVDELNTQGVNLAGIRSYASLIDVDRVDSNDVNAVLQAYGIEAARGCIIRQVRGVFGVYGIDIDPRHLNLIADYMTAEGSLRPFNRMGIDSNASPFLKMSFETCTQFLTQATMDGDCDTLSSPSARIVLGKVVENGTGSFDLLQPVELGNDFLAG
jgi:DNA-directed RNA polymerase I subunit RPA1